MDYSTMLSKLLVALHYFSFMTLVLPNNDPTLRSKVTQRKNFAVEPGQKL